MYAAHGIGLAAPQIGLSKRITVIDVNFKKDPADQLVLINHLEIIEREGQQFEEEGCLSLPDIQDKVKACREGQGSRSERRWRVVRSRRRRTSLRAFQHEIDHLDGVLFIDRLSRLKKDLTVRKIKKLIKNGEW